jgi:hypothetical protein
LGASAILTYWSQLLTNSHHAPPYASSLGIRQNTRVISVLILHLLIISRHVTFDEASFPFAEISDPPSSTFDFLSDMDCVPLLVGSSSFTGTSPGVGAAALVGLAPQAAANGTHGSPRFGAAASVGLVPWTAASSTDGPPLGFGATAPVGSQPQVATSSTDASAHPGTTPASSPLLVVASAPSAPVANSTTTVSA